MAVRTVGDWAVPMDARLVASLVVPKAVRKDFPMAVRKERQTAARSAALTAVT